MSHRDDNDPDKVEAERRAAALAQRRASDPTVQSLAAESAANEALAIRKPSPPASHNGPTIAVFIASTVALVVGLTVGVSVIAGLGAAAMAACIHRLSSNK